MSGAAAYTVDGQTVADKVFYAAACDTQRSVVIEACAGAGKTWILVSRILRALLDGAQPQQILAITFTRKAAGEMRSRLDEWLLKFSAACSTSSEREAELVLRGCSAAQARALAPQLGGLHEQLLRGGRNVEVRTFLSWFAQLTQHAPMEALARLGLPAAYDTIEDTDPLQAPLFNRFHRAVLADASLHADYLALVARHRRTTVLQWLKSAWKRGPELARADGAGHVDGAVPQACVIWPECEPGQDPATALLRGAPAQRAAELARQMGRSALKTAQDRAGRLEKALQQQSPEAVFIGAWDALFNADGKLRARLGDGPLLNQVADDLQTLKVQREQQQAHDDHQMMLRLSRVLLAEYAQLKRQRGLLDMADLERVAEALLGDTELAGWVQERLDQRVRHVLIDEFQDTSPLQWQVLLGWLSSYAGAGGGVSGQRPPAVFIVGDPKQSIYRFRGAEPRVFAAARDFLLDGLDARLLQCDHTRRCAPEVLGALNHVFEGAAAQGDWGPFRAHTTSSTALGGVYRLAGVKRPAKVKKTPSASAWRDSLTQPRDEAERQLRAEEGEQAAEAVAGLMTTQALAPADIMVLARKRSSLTWVADALAQRGIAHVVAETLWLHEAPEALDLVALLDVLASPGHDLSLARALKSPVFGTDDDDLTWLARRARQVSPAQAWLRLLLAAADLPSAALQRSQRLLAQWTAVADALTPHDLLDRIIHEGDVPARVAAAVPAARRVTALRAIDSLLAATLGEQGGRFASLYGFVRAVRAGRLKAQPAAPAAAVQLMTVHGAKGLEAPAVVLMDTDPEARASHEPGLVLDWPVDDAAPRLVAFVRKPSSPPYSLVQLCEMEDRAQAREELNGLYVAMTRARRWLVFSRTAPHRAAHANPAWSRVEAAAQRWISDDAAADTPAQASKLSTAEVPVLPALTWRGAETAVSVDARDLKTARLGEAVHRVLEWAGQPAAALSRSRLLAACEAAATSFGLPALMPQAAQRVHQIAQQILDSPSCARFFSGPALIWAGNEVSLAAVDSPPEEVMRVDRLVLLAADKPETAATWWVLDYKLNSRPEQTADYRTQMARYIAAVRALQPGDPVRGAFITGAGVVVEV